MKIDSCHFGERKISLTTQTMVKLVNVICQKYFRRLTRLTSITSYIIEAKYPVEFFATGGCRFTDFKYDHCDELYERFASEIVKARSNDFILYHQAFNLFIVGADGKNKFYDYSKFNTNKKYHIQKN